ncbi:MAG TPA: DUF1003 domain-containing protein [Longimicrobium sp.]|nr:DUF1003 domain-containing protein [Longimicrobium sp.]
MSSHPPEFARRILHREWETLTALERRVVEQVLARTHAAKAGRADDTRTFGQRVADRIAGFGGSWTFILSFLAVLVTWVVLNSVVLARRNEAWDPYPYILLNLFLSMLAALQAPIIMMSQNRQAARDRLDAAHDYEVNLKAEIEIRALHEKLDLLREESWADLVEMQRRQIELLEELLGRGRAGSA